MSSRFNLHLNCSTGIDVDWREIKFHPDYKSEIDAVDIKKLAASMINVGYFNPIIVLKKDDGYYCYDGHKRLKTLEYLTEQHEGFPTLNVPEKMPVLVADFEGFGDIKKLVHLRKPNPVLYARMFEGCW